MANNSNKLREKNSVGIVRRTNQNSEFLQKLKDHLKVLFQFDCADLDFGIYRIMNYKRKEIEKFIEDDLIGVVEKEFEKYKVQNQQELLERIEGKKKEITKLEKELGEKILNNDEIEEKFRDRPFAKGYLELKKQIDEIDITDSIQSEVFNDLYDFFSRYYEDGDFISKRRYSSKQNKYAIPYSGEEVKLYWANFDQYYIKTGEVFKDYEFNQKDWKFIFRTVLADVEASNVKGNRRYFFLSSDDPVKISSKTCLIKFGYRMLTNGDLRQYSVKTKDGKTKTTGIKQDELNPILRDKILNSIAPLEPKAILNETQDEKTILEKHLHKYTRKITSDFFIHKTLKEFLERELDYFIKTEVLDIESFDTEKERYFDRHIIRSKVVKNIGERIIEFLSQIEDYQKMLWEKRKFVLKTDYIIGFQTLRKLLNEDLYNQIKKSVLPEIFKKIAYKEDVARTIKGVFKQPSFNIYVKDVTFNKVGIRITYFIRFTDEEKFKEYRKNNNNPKYIKTEETVRGKRTKCYFADYESDKLVKEIPYDRIYIDTQYFNESFKENLLEILAEKGSLDQLLDGVLIKSENWQAMNLVLGKYKEKAKCIYIDPPYNTGSDEFLYKDRYQHSCWISMMYDRLNLSKSFLCKGGSLYASIDWNESHSLRKILDITFGEENFQREIIWNTGENISGFKSIAPNWIRQHDTIYFYSRNPAGLVFNKLWKPLNRGELSNWIDIIGNDKTNVYIEKWEKGKLGKIRLKDIKIKPLGDVWNDILSFQYSEPRVTESWFFDTQKVERLLQRIIQSSTHPGDLVIDFFLGSGTTSAVAHKLSRKFIGIEMLDYFENKVLTRMKSIIMGENRSHLSKEVNWQGGGFFKYHYLEQYEDALHNIEFPQEEKGQKLLQLLPEEAKSEYLMKYMLKFETEESPSLLNLQQFENPFEYKLKIISNSEGEEIVNVDLVETFNYLVGLKVDRYKFLKENGRKYVFVFGERNNRRTAIVWRPFKNIDLKKDKEIVDKELANFNSDEIFINGDSFVKGYKPIESEFKTLAGV